MDYKADASFSASEFHEMALLAIRKPGLSYAKRRAISLALRAMPDGHSCPRAFLSWDKRALVAAIKAAN